RLARIAAGELERLVLPWLPLLRGPSEAAAIAEWQRLAAPEPDGRSRSDFGALALVFAELAGTASVWRKALKGWNVKESPQVLEWQREALFERGKGDVQRAVLRRFGVPLPADLADQLAGLHSLAEL